MRTCTADNPHENLVSESWFTDGGLELEACERLFTRFRKTVYREAGEVSRTTGMRRDGHP